MNIKAIKGLVIILGSPNDSAGNIPKMGQGRLLKGLEEFSVRQSLGWKILLTGGLGAHFNTTDKPHALYAKRFLVKQGVLEDDILELVLSRNTVEDALKAVPIVEKYQVNDLLIVSSDFHLPRVKYIFQEVFPDKNLFFSKAEYLTGCSKEEEERLLKHEEAELKKLDQAGESAFN